MYGKDGQVREIVKVMQLRGHKVSEFEARKILDDGRI